jgi:hypothetical protein
MRNEGITSLGDKNSSSYAGAVDAFSAATRGTSNSQGTGTLDTFAQNFNFSAKADTAAKNNKVPAVSGDDDPYTYTGMTLMTGSYYTADHKT